MQRRSSRTESGFRRAVSIRTSSANQRPPVASGTLRTLFLTLFLRGRTSRGLEKESVPKSVGQKLRGTVLWYVLFGMLALMFAGQPVFLVSVFLHAMTLMFLGMFVASSAGEVLFNREEADILMHRPIDPRALLWAKVWVLTEVSLWLAGAFNVAGLFVGTFSQAGSWWFVPAHAASTALQALFCTGCVVLVYQLCLRWFGRERLERLMTMAQILLSVAAVAGSQVFPYVFQFIDRGQAVAALPWWILLFPPAWFAGIDDALAGSGGWGSWLLAGMGCMATVIVLWLAFGKLAHNYETGLQFLNESSGRRVSTGGGRRWLDRIVDCPPLRWWLRDATQRAAFLLTAAYLARDRDVKLRVYPAVAPFLVIPLVFIIRETAAKEGSFGGGFGFAFSSAYVGVVPLMAVNLLQYSQHWQASDLFRAAPLAGPAPICHGTRKAVLCLLTVPLVLVLAGSAWLIQRDVATMALILPGLMAVPVMALVPSVGGQAIPLSQPVEGGKSATRGITLLGTQVASLALSLVALIAWNAGWLILLLVVELFAVVTLYSFLRRNLDRAEWPSQD